VVVAPGGFPPEEKSAYELGGVPVFSHTETALQGIAAILRKSPPAPPAFSDPITPVVLPSRAGPMREPESLALLAAHGIAAVATHVCVSEQQILDAAEQVGWPVVLKGVVDGVAHKTERGLVRVGLQNRAALKEAYRSLGCAQVIVQPMLAGGLELIAGITRAPGVGPLLLAGLGGIFAEALDSVLLWPIPVAIEEIKDSIAASALGRIFASPRWNDQRSRDAFIELLGALQRFALAAGDRLQAIDINPVILGSGRAVAVDALVIPRAE
jgi:acetate---CoA ligase (ADP-forming)